MARERLDFFDPGKARGGRAGPDVGRDGAAEPPAGAAPLTVSALVARIKSALAAAFPQRVAVVGELSNVKLHSSGHLYFRVKDSGAALDAVMWRSDAARLKFRPTDGLEVVAEGRVEVYDVRGQLQLYVERLTPKGAGALELAFRQLQQKLAAEGLFDSRRKKPIPRFPRAVGVVTSPTGAAVRDIRRTLARRWPAAGVFLVPALVQGEGAAESVAQAVRLLDANAERYAIDTILVARGGGSLEDLWAFNEEVVARAVFAARTPVISGVGHEVDVTICDLVADVRAATPTAAAELAVPDAAEVRQTVASLASRLLRGVREELRAAKAAMDGLLRSAVFRDPMSRVRASAQRIDELSHRLGGALRHLASRQRRRLEPLADRLGALHPLRLLDRARVRLGEALHRLRWALGHQSKVSGDALAVFHRRLEARHPRNRFALARQQLAALARQLDSLSHRSVLRRGFSITRGPGGEILRSAGDVRPGDRLETELTDGRVRSTVEGAAPKPVRKPRKGPSDNPTLFD
ncbi:MAG TPA: exodeoxyribonuclease VII large subunit [Phycisphaerales bacterium]|nr:exodeoxyribonuclease VII large subunit [Phycisphaerales bacterium]